MTELSKLSSKLRCKLQGEEAALAEAALMKLIVDTPEQERYFVADLAFRIDYFVRWPKRPELLWEGCTRIKYHSFPDALKRDAKAAGISLDRRSNGPAIVAFLLAGGERPLRNDRGTGWSIHHIYDGKFPFPGRQETQHAVKDGKHFSQSAGLVAVHPLFDRAAEVYPEIAWTLRIDAMWRFKYDPDGVFSSGRINEYGFADDVIPLVRLKQT